MDNHQGGLSHPATVAEEAEKGQNRQVYTSMSKEASELMGRNDNGLASNTNIIQELSNSAAHLRDAASHTATAANQAGKRMSETLERLQERRQEMQKTMANKKMTFARDSKRMSRKTAAKSHKARKAAKLRAQAMATAIRENRQQKQNRQSWPLVAAAFAAGTAIGAIASMLLQRSREMNWEEFNLREQAQAAKGKLSDAVGTVREKASTAAENMRNKTNESGEETKKGPREVTTPIPESQQPTMAGPDTQTATESQVLHNGRVHR